MLLVIVDNGVTWMKMAAVGTWHHCDLLATRVDPGNIQRTIPHGQPGLPRLLSLRRGSDCLPRSLAHGSDPLKIVFSRKGFDSKSGGGPSPIIDGTMFNLPIPSGKYPSKSTYRDLGLGEVVSMVSKGCAADTLCHEDPMFYEGRCAFGQTGISQYHLDNNNVKEGDVFLFFGLFAELGSRDRHHRIFGYLSVERVVPIGAHPRGDEVEPMLRRHPHTIRDWATDEKWGPNNTIYIDRGKTTPKPLEVLRLTKRNGLASHWIVPPWLRETELTYHKRRSRWLEDGSLRVVGRGQEFITDIGDRSEANKWLNEVITAIETDE
jgi:Nucleotide modification associated domain 3